MLNCNFEALNRNLALARITKFSTRNTVSLPCGRGEVGQGGFVGRVARLQIIGCQLRTTMSNYDVLNAGTGTMVVLFI